MIAIGNQFGGPEQRGTLIDNMLNVAMNVAAENRDSDYDSGKDAWINPIYMVPGSIYQPEFEGYKVGHFSAKKKGLVVMIAVPQSVANGKNIPNFIIQSLLEAIPLAANHFEKKGINFDIKKAGNIVEIISQRLNAEWDKLPFYRKFI